MNEKIICYDMILHEIEYEMGMFNKNQLNDSYVEER